MGVLFWGKPKKVRSTEAHNDYYASDCGVPGTYVPNMSDKDRALWKAKKIGGDRARVEIRKTASGMSPADGSRIYGKVLVVVTKDRIQISVAGKAVVDATEFTQAIAEAQTALRTP